ncbi:MAG: hypothetical protein C4516_04780 [Oxalobacter sp.]|nr:MAG: hypothetical protein C4516_04780 [Oxalobacter sp.]
MSTLIQRLAELSFGSDFLKYAGVSHEDDGLNACEEYLMERAYQHLQHEKNVNICNQDEVFRTLHYLLMKPHDDWREA